MTEPSPPRPARPPVDRSVQSLLRRCGLRARRGHPFNDKERLDVEEYCISGLGQGAGGQDAGRRGKPLLIKLKGRVEAFYR
jgi:hypothetical protein